MSTPLLQKQRQWHCNSVVSRSLMAAFCVLQCSGLFDDKGTSTFLKLRRLRAMSQLGGINYANYSQWLTTTYKNPYKLLVNHCRINVRKHFSERIRYGSHSITCIQHHICRYPYSVPRRRHHAYTHSERLSSTYYSFIDTQEDEWLTWLW